MVGPGSIASVAYVSESCAEARRNHPSRRAWKRRRKSCCEWQKSEAPMNDRTCNNRAVLCALCLFLIGGPGLGQRIQRRQSALNRQLIAALGHGDMKRALALAEAGADPNTRYKNGPVKVISED